MVPVKKKSGKLKSILIFLVILFLSSYFISSAIQQIYGDHKHGNVALIRIRGPIMVDKSSDFISQSHASSENIIRLIDEADENPSIKAFIFDINSPGGSAVASDEIASRIKKLDKPTIALIREIGASGGYWIASSADVIVANKMSITGSIGVISSYLEFSGLFSRYNVTYQRMVSGEYKDIGTPFKRLTDQENIILQGKLDTIHEFFIEEIALNRNLTIPEVEELSTGEFYLGVEAKEVGLIDVIGTKDDAIAIIEKDINESAILAEYEQEESLFDVLGRLFSKMSFFVGKGLGSEFNIGTKSAGFFL